MLISGTAGESMTHETAENILVGHFEPNGHRHSWLVAAGSNPAYEQFALQCPRVVHVAEMLYDDIMPTDAYTWVLEGRSAEQGMCTKRANPSDVSADATHGRNRP